MKTFYRAGQWFAMRAELRKLFKRVFFAGEHIADWESSVEGAVVTGKAAAAVLSIDPEE
jgi:monoamine oxidase